MYIYTAAAAAARRNSLESELRPKNVVDINLSCKNVAAKKEDEMKRTLSRVKSIKERVEMYTNGEDEKIDIDKLKTEELQDVIDDPTLNEKEQESLRLYYFIIWIYVFSMNVGSLSASFGLHISYLIVFASHIH